MASQVRPVPGPEIRQATAADEAAIRGLVRGARLNPGDLDWRRFLVADDAGTVVACAQVRVHAAGSRELSSVVVHPDRQGQGLGRAIAEATIEGEPVRPLYLLTESRTEAFWAKLGFGTIDEDEVPADLRRSLRFGRLVTAVASPLAGRRLRIVAMRRDAP